MERFFGGIKDLAGKPDALFVIDPNREKNAVKEARVSGIPVVALIDSNSDPDMVQYPIPANDDARKSIEYIVTAVLEGFAAGKASRNSKK